MLEVNMDIKVVKTDFFQSTSNGGKKSSILNCVEVIGPF